MSLNGEETQAEVEEGGGQKGTNNCGVDEGKSWLLW